MAYREETEGLRARVSELEQELAKAHAKISVLEGRRTGGGLGQTLLGGPLTLTHQIELEGELPVAAHEEIVDVLREHFGSLGQVTTVGRTLAWTSIGTPTTRFAEVTISVRRGATRIRASERLGNLAGGLYGGIVGGAGGGGMGLIVPLSLALGIAALIPLITVTWLLLVYAVVRISYARVTARRDAQLASAVDSIAGIARAQMSHGNTAVRVEEEHTDLEEDDAARRRRPHANR